MGAAPAEDRALVVILAVFATLLSAFARLVADRREALLLEGCQDLMLIAVPRKRRKRVGTSN